MEERTINDKDGREITLRADFPDERIDAYHNNKHIGEFTFREINNEYYSELLVLRMYLDYIPGFTGKGIGTEIVNWAEEYSGHTVIFGKDDGSEGDCSSHLTGNGRQFAEHIYSIKNSRL